MTIHKEGYATLTITILALAALHIISDQFLSGYPVIRAIILAVSILLFLIVLQFFRHPKRHTVMNDTMMIAPADGKVVVIEETDEPEFLKDKRIQVSIFMSPLNVHVNRYPVSGKVIFSKYHPGLYLVAWHPKSSTENERTTVVIETKNKIPVLMRQIAGALARRIVCYSKEGDVATQGGEMGFIKFGSRVDIFLPLNAQIKVQLNQKVTGGETVIAEVG
ncbi:MAG: phosphatidylserine decarboxylase family protein [Bacteroidetes bacterium]|nr:phosphatidylserine decarboxylase family protein [Bacteroidota bacterium]